MSRLTMLFNAITALATLAIALVAVWGFFFTDIPEQLVRQFRADIAEAQEQLTDLRIERRARARELEEAQSELRKLQGERRNVIEEVARLTEDKKQAAKELAAIRRDRDEYLANIMRLEVKDFVSSVQRRIGKHWNAVERLKEYPETLDWIREGEKLDRDSNRPEDWVRFREWIERAPPEWLSYQLQRSLGQGGFNRKVPVQKILESFRSTMTFDPDKPVPTAYSLLERSLESDSFTLLLPKDRARVFRVIRQHMSEHIQELSHPLSPALPSGWGRNDVPAAVAELEKAHSLARRSLAELRSKLER